MSEGCLLICDMCRESREIRKPGAGDQGLGVGNREQGNKGRGIREQPGARGCRKLGDKETWKREHRYRECRGTGGTSS